MSTIIVHVTREMYDPPLIDETKWPEALAVIKEAPEAEYPEALIHVNDWPRAEYYIDAEEAEAQLKPIVMRAIAAYNDRQQRTGE